MREKILCNWFALTESIRMIPIVWKMVHIWGRYPPFDDDDWIFLQEHYPYEFKQMRTRMDKLKKKLK